MRHSIRPYELKYNSFRLNCHEKRIKDNPGYWKLIFAKLPLLLDIGEKKQAVALITSEKGMPLPLAYVRLLREEYLVLLEREYAQKFLRNIDAYSAMYRDYPIFHVTAAVAYDVDENVSAATKSLDAVRDQTPVFVSAVLTRASIAAKQGKVLEAVDLYRRVSNLTPYDISKKLSLAYALFEAKEYVATKDVIAEIRKSQRYFARRDIEYLERDIDYRLNLNNPQRLNPPR